jgi:L-rhamnose isomerase
VVTWAAGVSTVTDTAALVRSAASEIKTHWQIARKSRFDRLGVGVLSALRQLVSLVAMMPRRGDAAELYMYSD